MPSSMRVEGTVAEGFEGVREEFAAVLEAEAHDTGAQLAVYRHGRRVVDLWAEGAEPATGGELTGLHSVTKGAAHLVVALLVQDGILELDREVAAYWPEFAAEGKDALTLRELLQHRAGAIGVEGGFTLDELADDRLLARRLAGHRPYWKPGTRSGYHALVIGALTGEVVFRATGRTLKEHYEKRIRAPHGLDFHLGLPEWLEPHYRPVLPMRPTPEQAAELAAAEAPGEALRVAFNWHAAEPTDLVEYANSRTIRANGPASAGGVGNARGVAGMYAAAISGLDGAAPLLKPDTIAEFTGLQTPGPDAVTGEPDLFALGFRASQVVYPYLGADSFGHSGAAGAESWADPGTGLAYAYTRRLWAYPGGAAPENLRLGAAVLGAYAESSD
ncbi:serine hydrolase domain-containing protein [Streptomyces monticola]|uniref:Serine hydrolase domain-containing protein n=1 Tax=Streptomyces monticola TaxID=2666263 RepID=A0ABW2JFS7_9ACTN